MKNEIEKQAEKLAAQRIGARAGAQATEIFGRMFANWALENPREAEELFNRVMAIVSKFMRKVDL